MNINTIRLRLALGWLGMFLPWISLILSLIFGYGIPDSISATYYFAPTITPFTVILGSASLLLISYAGYDKHDDIICTIAGIFGLLICIFPCSDSDLQYVGMLQLPIAISGWLHNICAISFFALLAYNSFFLFTKSSGCMTKNKESRNIIYKGCGIGMLVAFLLLIPLSYLDIHGGIWLIEMIALSFFGISWLTKSDIYPWLFCDSPYTD